MPVPEEFRFPDFDPVSVEFEDYKAGSGKADAGTPKQTGSGAKISSWTPPSPSRTKAIGKRGEQVVWGKELQRLHDLGYPDPHQILQWVSKDMRPAIMILHQKMRTTTIFGLKRKRQKMILTILVGRKQRLTWLFQLVIDTTYTEYTEPRRPIPE